MISSSFDSLFSTHNLTQLTHDELQRIETLINSRQYSISQLANYFKKDRKRFLEYLQKQGCNITKMSPGRIPKPVAPEVRDLIIEAHQKTRQGSTKTYFQILHDMQQVQDLGEHEISSNYSYIPPKSIAPSYYRVAQVFKNANLFQYDRQQLPDIGKSKYEACFVNMFWHVDIHFIEHDKERPFYSLIDDNSRYIVGYGELPDCTADSCLNILKNAIEEYGKPFAIWSDNGSETKSIFDEFLNDNGIHHIRTRVYTPQQNGKIERFWRTFENLYQSETIDEIINNYHNSPHTSLPFISIEMNGRKVKRPQTPREAFENQPKWNCGICPEWVINGTRCKCFEKEWKFIHCID